MSSRTIHIASHECDRASRKQLIALLCNGDLPDVVLPFSISVLEYELNGSPHTVTIVDRDYDGLQFDVAFVDGYSIDNEDEMPDNWNQWMDRIENNADIFVWNGEEGVQCLDVIRRAHGRQPMKSGIDHDALWRDYIGVGDAPLIRTSLWV